MVNFKFTVPNGVALVGATKQINEELAKTYEAIGLGFIVKETKVKPKKNK